MVIISADLNVGNGALSVTAQATSAITTLSVDVVNQSTNGVALTVSSFTPPTDLTDGTWTATVTGAELPPGIYDLNVSAADQGGDSASATDISTVYWYGTAVPTLTASTNTISYGNSMVTVSGTVSYQAPGGGTPQPDPSVKVNLLSSYDGVVATFSTASDGTFRQSVALTPDSYYVEPTGLTDTYADASTEITESATPDPVRMTAKETPYKSDYGNKITVSGTLTYQSGSKWLPLTSQQVNVSLPGAGGQTTTNAAGVYKFVTKAVSGGQWTAYSYPDAAESGLLTFPTTENSGYLKVAELVKFHWFRAVRRPGRHIAASGCISAANFRLAQAGEPGPRVNIQYRTRSSGPWRNVRRIALQPGSIDNSCNVENADIFFHATFPAPTKKAYYRAYYPGEWIAGSYTGFAPGATRAVHVTV